MWFSNPLDSQRYRSQTLLRIDRTRRLPGDAPQTRTGRRDSRGISWHGNGLLWAGLRPDGVYAVQQDQVEADGSIFNKLLWATTPPESRPTISGERLDAPAPPLRVIAVNQGSFSSAQKPSYMSAVSFPTAGCWRLKARVADVSLTYVVEVVVEPPSNP